VDLDDSTIEPNWKQELERKKLALEIRELSRPWFQKPAYLAGLLPALIGIATVLVAWNSGYFNLQLERQRIDAANLQFQTTRLSAEIKDLQAERERLQAQREELSKAIETARSEEKHLSTLIKQREVLLKSVQRDLVIAELTSNLERLVRIAEPNGAVSVQWAIERALGKIPSDAALLEPTVAAVRKSLSTKDEFSSERVKLVREYLERSTTPPEMKSDLETILKGHQ
jgi:septal ring factor EnvC (AmiA/AmiB activator)